MGMIPWVPYSWFATFLIFRYLFEKVYCWLKPTHKFYVFAEWAVTPINIIHLTLPEYLISKLDPTLRMDVMSLRILCYAGLKCGGCCQFAGKYAHDYKRRGWNADAHVEMRYHVCSWSGRKFNATIYISKNKQCYTSDPSEQEPQQEVEIFLSEYLTHWICIEKLIIYSFEQSWWV